MSIDLCLKKEKIYSSCYNVDGVVSVSLWVTVEGSLLG